MATKQTSVWTVEWHELPFARACRIEREQFDAWLVETVLKAFGVRTKPHWPTRGADQTSVWLVERSQL